MDALGIAQESPKGCPWVFWAAGPGTLAQGSQSVVRYHPQAPDQPTSTINGEADRRRKGRGGDDDVSQGNGTAPCTGTRGIDEAANGHQLREHAQSQRSIVAVYGSG